MKGGYAKLELQFKITLDYYCVKPNVPRRTKLEENECKQCLKTDKKNLRILITLGSGAVVFGICNKL